MSRKVFGTKRDEMTGKLRKLHRPLIMGLHALHSSFNIIKNVKLKRLRWAGYVARMENPEMLRVLVGRPEEERPLGKLDADGGYYSNGFEEGGL